ncbi:ribosome biogenesis GTP-binding protein YihA/YsxC [Kroppenstedtia eburnea]|uniref:Probable GTP-binding protein EngB n=1 Tax=Kroppenstedtia eburnea TaxID=714067 RepID=A0A1N7M1L5_9BACL|nr:ribosome biogenesis GTP-binding protein YihA/YsxC [Kroppenstedtia eburnea]QKI81777.1 YihA family ribosome biogenesis GTP-binding protein [Kroppenstedtia eburnea]SIS79974.1 GTP-binding protein [Kroppenstedtia eburnea]
MKVTESEFVISAVGPAQYPADALPEIALAGRSNVGKSSLINRLIHRKNLARTSSKPGKTQTINFYRINGALFFADMPGYGFAKVPKSVKAAWGRMIEGYLSNRDELRGVIQVIDVRHPPTRDDIAMYEWLKHYRMPTMIVATKADKIPRGRWQKHLKQVREGLRLEAGVPLILFSAQTGQGKEEVWAEIRKWMPGAS